MILPHNQSYYHYPIEVTDVTLGPSDNCLGTRTGGASTLFFAAAEGSG